MCRFIARNKNQQKKITKKIINLPKMSRQNQTKKRKEQRKKRRNQLRKQKRKMQERQKKQQKNELIVINV